MFKKNCLLGSHNNLITLIIKINYKSTSLDIFKGKPPKKNLTKINVKEEFAMSWSIEHLMLLYTKSKVFVCNNTSV